MGLGFRASRTERGSVNRSRVARIAGAVINTRTRSGDSALLRVTDPRSDCGWLPSGIIIFIVCLDGGFLTQRRRVAKAQREMDGRVPPNAKLQVANGRRRSGFLPYALICLDHARLQGFLP